MDLKTYLAGRSEEIISQATGAIERADLTHYQNKGSDYIRERLAELYECISQCLSEEDVTPLESYMGRIAVKRFNDGFDLCEIQSAMQAMEKSIWRRIIDELPPDEHGTKLSVITALLGAGRDALARQYVSLATQTKVPCLDTRALMDWAN